MLEFYYVLLAMAEAAVQVIGSVLSNSLFRFLFGHIFIELQKFA